MKDRNLATRYARALLASLADPDDAARTDEFLGAIRDALDESADFRDVLLDPAIPNATRRSMLRSLSERAGMPSQVSNFLATVVDHGRTASLESIAELFHQERELRAGVIAAEITTATPLTDDLKQRTMDTLEKMTGRKIRLTTRLDRDILGGAVTRIGSTVYDGSLRSQLSQLRKKMIQE